MDRRKFLSESGGAIGAGAAAIAALASTHQPKASAQAQNYTTDESSAVFQVDDLVAEREELGRLYHSFLRVPGLHMGIYELAAHAEDPQEPHDEDEVYLVLEGEGKIRIENKVYDIKTGSLIYVEAHAEHKFEDITKDLTTLVFFASNKSDSA